MQFKSVQKESRTPTPVRALPPQSSVSTNFTTWTLCDPAGIRTQDPYIKSVLLYQLSYGIVIFCFLESNGLMDYFLGVRRGTPILKQCIATHSKCVSSDPAGIRTAAADRPEPIH